MKVLHVAFGLPPSRRGGLPLYVRDLVRAQSIAGNRVDFLCPGPYTLSGKPEIQPGYNRNSDYFVLNNPPPVPMTMGVSDPYRITREFPSKIFRRFLENRRPDIIHVHSLMGIPREFFDEAERVGIPIVFSTHDYYGLCAKATFWRDRYGDCAARPEFRDCARCNQNAPGFFFSWFNQSGLFPILRDSPFLAKIKRRIRSRFAEGPALEENAQMKHAVEMNQGFENLYRYYLSVFESLAAFHFNSSVSQKVFTEKCKATGRRIPLRLRDVFDRRSEFDRKADDRAHLRVGFIGNSSEYKGFPLLRRAVSALDVQERRRIEIHLWGGGFGLGEESKGGLFFPHGRFERNNLDRVFSLIDVLLVPSLWQETFNFTALEAFSYGVIPLVSENVGFKDILSEVDPLLVFKPEEEDLISRIRMLLEDGSINCLRSKIKNFGFDFRMEKHVEEIKYFYSSVVMTP